MPDFMRFLKRPLRNLEITTVLIPLAFCLQLFPFQHYMALSRLQHYSFTIFGCSLAFLIQSVLSWKNLTLSGRVALIGTTAYFMSAALVLYLNPWMDLDGSMNTEMQLEFRRKLSTYFMFGGLAVAAAWLAWSVDREKLKNTKAKEQPSPVMHTTDQDKLGN